MLQAGEMRIDIVLDSKDNTGYLVETDPKTDWIVANGGQQPPAHMRFDPVPVAQTLDAEYAIWVARAGHLKRDLNEIVTVIKAAGSNPLAAIEGIKGLVERVMNFVGGVDAQVVALETVAAKEATRLRRMVAEQRQDRLAKERQKTA